MLLIATALNSIEKDVNSAISEMHVISNGQLADSIDQHTQAGWTVSTFPSCPVVLINWEMWGCFVD